MQKQLGNMEVKPSRSLWDKLDEELEQGGFEQKVQSKLDNFEVVPYSDTWSKIESQLPLEPESRSWLRYLGVSLVALLFVSGIYIGYRLNEQQGKPLADATTPSSEMPAGSENMKDLASAPKGVNNNKPNSGGEQNERLNQAIKPKSSGITNTQSKVVVGGNKKPTIIPGMAKSLSSAEGNSSITVKPKDNAPDVSNKQSQPLAKQTNAETDKHEHPAPIQTSDVITAPTKILVAKSPETASSQQPSSTVAVNTNGELQPAKKDETLQQNQTNPSDVSPASNQVIASSKAARVDSLPQGNNSHEGIKGNVVSESISIKSDSSAQPLLSEASGTDKYDMDKPGRFSLVIMVGGHFSFNRLTAPSSSNLSFDENISLRKGLEKPKPDWNGGFLVDYMLSDRFRVASGIAMLNFNQEFYYDIVPAKGNTNGLGEVGAGVLNPNDSIVGGSSFSNTIRYSWTEIPLLFTYQLTRGTKWNIELQGGFSYAMLTSVNASLVSYDNTGLLVLRDKDAFPGLQNNFFAMLNPTLTYSLNEKVIFGLMPTVKYSLNSMVKNDQWVQQYPYFIGVSASLRRRF